MMVSSSSISSSRFLSAAASRSTSSSLVGARKRAGTFPLSVSTSLGAGFSFSALAGKAAGAMAMSNTNRRRILLFLLLWRAGVFQGVRVVADLVGPVLAVERPVLVPRGRHAGPVERLLGEVRADVEAGLQHLLLALGGLEPDDLLVSVEHLDEVGHVCEPSFDELARHLRHQGLLLGD